MVTEKGRDFCHFLNLLLGQLLEFILLLPVGCNAWKKVSNFKAFISCYFVGNLGCTPKLANSQC